MRTDVYDTFFVGYFRVWHLQLIVIYYYYITMSTVYTHIVGSITWRYTLDGNNNATIGDGTATHGNATTSGTGLSGAIIIPVTVGAQNYQVTNIGLFAFFNCTGITSVVIPNTVTNITGQAFYNNRLTTVTIPNLVTFIGSQAFMNNTLTSVKLGYSVTTIEAEAFRVNPNLTSINIPPSVTTIGTVGSGVFDQTNVNLVVTINAQQTINGVSTSFTGTSKSFFGNTSVDFSVPPPPTALSFVNNTLTIQNSIGSTNIVKVSFPLPAGSIMYSFNVTSLLNANRVNYSLDISGGANVSSGSIIRTGINLLGENNLTPAIDTTYILSMTCDSTNTYTIIGKMLGPGYTTIPYATPIILYTFDTDGTNSGSLGPSSNAIIPTSAQVQSYSTLSTIDTTRKLFGAASIYVGITAKYADSMPKFVFNSGTAWSISFWARHDPTQRGLRRAFTNMIPNSNPNYTDWNIRWEFNSENNFFIFKIGQTQVTFSSVSHPHIFTDGKWHHYTYSVSSNTSTGGFSIYIDNIEYAFFTAGLANNTDYRFILGGNHYRDVQDLTNLDEAGINGNFDDVRVYDYSLDSTQIQSLFISGQVASGVTVQQLLVSFTVKQLLAANVSVAALLAANVSVSALLAANASVSALLAANVSVSALLNANVSASQLLAAGVPFSQLVTYVQWLDLSATSNRINKSYVNSFIDLSGDMIIRNDGALIGGGDVSFNNITVAGSTTFAGDTTLKNRLFIGNDISVNGTLYVGGDLSVNGTFSGNFASGIIPTTAIINYPSSGSNVEITGNVQIAGDASFNGTTTVDLTTNTILQVSGNIAFTDGTLFSTYDNNILSGTFAEGNVIFKTSTFAAVTCTGTARAGSTVTSSDYRLKTNVTDLNQSYSVDKLEPIQYDNILSNKHEFGLIAHELQAVYPELVKGEKDGAEYQRVNYNGLIGVLVKEVQEIKRRIEDLYKK